jgi:hypothetical protein
MKLTVEAIPTPKGFVHPPAKYDALPRHEFSMGLIGKFINDHFYLVAAPGRLPIASLKDYYFHDCDQYDLL